MMLVIGGLRNVVEVCSTTQSYDSRLDLMKRFGKTAVSMVIGMLGKPGCPPRCVDQTRSVFRAVNMINPRGDLTRNSRKVEPKSRNYGII
jgi:hypothetical protein